MRTIKFRAWDKRTKKMIDWEWIEIYHDGARIVDVEGFMPDCELELMQFTGLLDKQGKEIYEGDILSCERSYWKEKRNLVVEWGGERYSLLNQKDNVDSEVMDKQSSFDVSEIDREVIGNIYENPELLKA